MVAAITRRGFLLISILVGLATRVLSAATAITSPLTARERRTLLLVARTIFSHRLLVEKHYEGAVQAIVDRCAGSAELRDTVRGHIAQLESSAFEQATDKDKITLLAGMQFTSFYRLIYRETLESVYGSAELWHTLSGVEPAPAG